MSTTRRAPKKQKVAPAPPEPASISVEGFDTKRTPRPDNRYDLPLSSALRVGNGNVYIYRYRVTVERIEEPREVIVDRLVTLYNNELNGARDRETLEAEAIRIGVENLKELARAAKVPAVAIESEWPGCEESGDPWTDGAK